VDWKVGCCESGNESAVSVNGRKYFDYIIAHLDFILDDVDCTYSKGF